MKYVFHFLLLVLILGFMDVSSADSASRESAITTTQPTAKSSDAEMIQLSFPEKVEVGLLLEYVSKRLSMNIHYDPSIGKKSVTIISPTRIPKASLIGLLQSVLKMAGLVMVDSDQPGWKKIIENKDLLTTTQKINRDQTNLEDQAANTAITQIFHLHHATTTSIEKAIKPLLSKPGGNSFAITDTDIIITDYAGKLRRVASLIKLMDQPGKEVNVRFISVKHRDADKLAPEINEILKKRQAISSSIENKAKKKNVDVSAEKLTNQIVIISAKGDDTEALELLKALDVPTNTQTHTYSFEHISPQRIDKLIRSLISLESKKQPYESVIDEESLTLVAVTSKDVHKQLTDLKCQLDVAPKVTTKSYLFQYVSPKRVEKLVRDLMREDKKKKDYKSTIDEESGLFIVTATAGIHSQIQSLKDQLDTPDVAEDLSHIRSYKLVNATASEVLETISSLDSGDGGLAALASKVDQDSFTNKVKEFAGPNRPPSAAGKVAPKPPVYTPTPSGMNEPAKNWRPKAATKKTSNATVMADPNTNTIIVVAPPPIQRMYKELIAILDKRQPQVLIEATIVTLDTSNNFSLGVEIGRAGTVGSDGEYMVFSSFGLSNVDPLTGKLSLIPGLGFNGALISTDMVDIIIRALAGSGRTKVLSAPKILVNDNSPATLVSVNEAPFTSVNASDTVATTSFAGYSSAGTSISMTPHISKGDHVVLDYTITLSSFTGTGSDGIPPPRQTNTITSKITIPDGNAVIVGGLNRKDSSETKTKIPFFGDIPGLEYLASSRSQNSSESTLFIFIRPIILRDDQFEDLKYLSSRDLEKAGLPPNHPASPALLME